MVQGPCQRENQSVYMCLFVFACVFRTNVRQTKNAVILEKKYCSITNMVQGPGHWENQSFYVVCVCVCVCVNE